MSVAHGRDLSARSPKESLHSIAHSPAAGPISRSVSGASALRRPKNARALSRFAVERRLSLRGHGTLKRALYADSKKRLNTLDTMSSIRSRTPCEHHVSGR